MKSKLFEELFSTPLRNGLTKPKKVRGEGYKMVNMGELFRYGRIENIEMDRVPLSDKEYQASLLEYGDLLFARQSLVLEGAGKCSIFLEDEEEVCFESHIIRCRLDKKASNPLFFYYFFSSESGRSLIKTIVEQGAGAAGIRGKDLAQLEVPYVTLERQNYIANQLSHLDSLISLNSQVNQTLEQIAQAIFKSWFVDFEPTKAKIAAREALLAENPDAPPEQIAIAEQQAAIQAIAGAGDIIPTEQLQTIADLFPNQMVDSELGEIPEGWLAGTIGDIAKARGGYAFKSKEFKQQGHPVVKIKNITGSGNVDITGCNMIDELSATKAARFILQEGDLLMAMTGATVGKVGLLNTFGKKVYLNQRVAKFESEKFGSDIAWYLYCAFARAELSDLIIGAAQGSAQPNISSNGIESQNLIIATDGIIKLFFELVRPIFKQVLQNNVESQTLSDIRDAILPKLLSGQIERV